MAENLNRNKLFDIKAVFGSVCRHEFPQKFFNLKHGERYLIMCRVNAFLDVIGINLFLHICVLSHYEINLISLKIVRSGIYHVISNCLNLCPICLVVA